ncbi:2-oxoacid:ferredoxin oxidoreductase subunit gamma [Candidatus Aerophobetes bacterium]|uniref:2-oxoacid:ferredoxin oxidoreductase subunit gamma n=1 Tax=Aerophobetes bacterium TaxID=2030807 RepID=A0A662DEA3_UNCAE|nr:MAG: 2-oxoacid:ferredoxin oxidoreductase subunit gamma [Candidatus Aerophobetes bacterium]
MDDGRCEIRLSGAGGQGLILAGLILAEAAGIYDGKNVVQTQSYGPEARGGASRSEVIISEEEIDYPKVVNPDILLALTQEACDKYYRELKKDGVLIVDSFYVKKVPSHRNLICLPITSIAEKEVGRKLVANIVALGILTEFTGIVSKEAIKKAVLRRVPKGTEKINERALGVGFRIGREEKKHLN